MDSAKTTARHPYEQFAWRSLVGLAVVITAATGFGLLLLLVRPVHPQPGKRPSTVAGRSSAAPPPGPAGTAGCCRSRMAAAVSSRLGKP